VEIRIADSGPGIPPELREQIFNPFVTTKKSGVGLGLSIVSKIIDGHHGTIRVGTSDADAANGSQGGACFVIFLPSAGETSNVANSEHLVIS
jgi:signal transduction histidine kinase